MNPYLLDRLEEMNPSGRSGTWEIQNDQSLKEVVPPSQEELDNYKKYYLASIDKQLPFETILRSDLQDKKIDEERFDKFIKIYNQQQKLQKQYNQELKDQALFDLGSRLSGDIPRYTEENPARLAKGGALRKITSSDNDPTIADFLATAAAGIVPGGLLVYGADRYGKRMSETPQRISPEDQELINTRIEELLMADPVNEMRATTPDMFERQKLGIEGLLSNLYEPRRARDIAETISTGVDFSPAGIPTAVAEGFRMMGDDQPLMGSAMALLAMGPFKGLSKAQLQKVYEKLQREMRETIPEINARAQSMWKSFSETGNKADEFDAKRLTGQAERMKKRNLREQEEVKELLKQDEFPFELSAVPDSGTKKRGFLDEFAEQNPAFKKMLVEGRKDEGYIKAVPSKTPKQVKGIINATPETKKLYQEILDSPSRINTRDHQKVGKETSEQLREINKRIQEADLEDRNEVLRLLARLKDKKSK